MTRATKFGIFLLVFLLVMPLAYAQEDSQGCRDYPSLSRMPDHYIYSCETIDWGAIDFVDESGNSIKIEGKIYKIEYNLKEGAKEPSPLQIIRNYENAIKEIGGRIVYNKDPDMNKTWLEFEKAGKKVDVYVLADWGGYYLTIIERKGMEQEVVASAKSLLNDVESKGHASVYGIYFDFNSAKIKPESEKAIKEIAKLLQQNPNLKLHVVGHTDNVGKINYNMKLSKARAAAVVKELVTKYHISPKRLAAYSVASLAPVASNKTEEGRAKNRRVELVEQ